MKTKDQLTIIIVVAMVVTYGVQFTLRYRIFPRETYELRNRGRLWSDLISLIVFELFLLYTHKIVWTKGSDGNYVLKKKYRLGIIAVDILSCFMLLVAIRQLILY